MSCNASLIITWIRYYNFLSVKIILYWTYDDGLRDINFDCSLMENVRVKRAGYAFRQLYLQFLYRYKMLAGPTWPRWAGKPQEGVKILMQVQGVPEDEYAFGKTKLFIRNPKTVSCSHVTLIKNCQASHTLYFVTVIHKL